MQYDARFEKVNSNLRENQTTERENQFRDMCKYLKSEGIGDFTETKYDIIFRVKKGSRKKFNIATGGVWIEGKKLTFVKSIAHLELDSSFISLVNIRNSAHIWIKY